jgi:hypothetical protein
MNSSRTSPDNFDELIEADNTTPFSPIKQSPNTMKEMYTMLLRTPPSPGGTVKTTIYPRERRMPSMSLKQEEENIEIPSSNYNRTFRTPAILHLSSPSPPIGIKTRDNKEIVRLSKERNPKGICK